VIVEPRIILVEAAQHALLESRDIVPDVQYLGSIISATRP